MSELTQKTTHVAESLALLATQFRDKPNLAAFITALVRQVQDLENAQFQIYVAFVVANATFAQLDVLGRIVGEDRQGRDDTTYRVYISARIAINISSGTRDEILRIMGAIMGFAGTLKEAFPASFRYEAGLVSANAADFAAVLKTITAAGVASSLQYRTDPGTPFQFDGPPGSGFDQGHFEDVI